MAREIRPMRGEGLHDRMVEHLRSACATCVYGYFCPNCGARVTGGGDA